MKKKISQIQFLMKRPPSSHAVFDDNRHQTKKKRKEK